MPEQIFVSYSRKDNWRPIFEAAIGGGYYKTIFQLWFAESKIEVGDQWEIAIENAISASRIALVLVSKGFTSSDVVFEQELPVILERARAGGAIVVWVPIDAVPPDILKKAGLDLLQAAWEPSNPLSELKEPELGAALMQIGSILANRIELLQTTSKGLLDYLRPTVIGAIKDAKTVVGDPFAAGDHSIFYKAKRGDSDFVIKALVPAPGRPWLNGDFVRRANLVSNVENSTAIKIRNVFPDPRVPCVAMDYVAHPTLAMHLKEGKGKLDAKLVADVLAQLARLAGQLHQMDGNPIIGPVRPSHVHYDSAKPKKAFISLLPIVSETLATCRDNPTWFQDFGGLPYLSPERYYGEPVDGSTDQYHLALLGLELLQGKPPVQVEKFADLKDMATFFDSPRSFFDKEFRRDYPGFSFVLAQMLERHPANRWATISDLTSALRDVKAEKIPDAVKQHADAQYSDTLQDNAEFFRSFYQILLGKSPDIRALFKSGGSIDEQARKLNNAMARILTFNKRLRTARLENEINRHRGMAIKAEHFGYFRDAFVEALSTAKITDGRSHDAWRAVLDPALNYMRDEIAKPPP
jgi:hemoglobin-like flavoprotein